MSKKTEVITQGKEYILMNPEPPFSEEITQYPPVLSQKAVDIADIVVAIAVQTIVIIVSALIRTEFLIGTTMNKVAAVKTSFFHSTKVLIKI